VDSLLIKTFYGIMYVRRCRLMLTPMHVGKEGLVNLERAPEGFDGEVAYIDGGDRVSQRMIALGIVPGTHIKVIRNSAYGPLIIDVEGTRIAIGRGVSSKVWLKR